jgi:hypothetical protein
MKSIKREFKKEIAEVEREYWVYWGVKGGTQLEIGDADAESVNAEIVAEVQMLAFNPSVQQHQELVKLFNDIKVELNKPTPAAGKLKAVIPILPGILSYEIMKAVIDSCVIYRLNNIIRHFPL